MAQDYVRRRAQKSWRRRRGSIGGSASAVRQLKDMSDAEIKALELEHGCKVKRPSDTAVTKCKSCSAPIVWTRTEKGKRLPCDLEPAADGLFFLFRRAAFIEAIYVNSSHHSAAKARTLGQKRYRPHRCKS
jgi:hypothetical protein